MRLASLLPDVLQGELLLTENLIESLAEPDPGDLDPDPHSHPHQVLPESNPGHGPRSRVPAHPPRVTSMTLWGPEGRH